MKIANRYRPLIFGLGAALGWVTPSEARFLQVDPVGYKDQTNLYAYVGDDPVNRSDPTGLFRDIYIGGASDYNSRIVASYAERQVAAHPNRSILYFSGGDRHGIAQAIETTPRGEPLNIAGHSLGGAEAIRQANATNRHVDNLITIDPVDLPGRAVSPNLSLENVGTWTNVTANPTTSDGSDRVAALGGKVDASVTNQADQNISSSAHHGQFDQMMRDSRAGRAIERSYRRRDNGN